MLSVPAGDGGTGAPGLQEPSLDALRMRRNAHVCFSRVTPWQNTAVEEEHQCEGNGSGMRDGYRKKHLGRQEEFCHLQEQERKFEILSL